MLAKSPSFSCNFRFAHRARRGTAEIELLLVIMYLLLPILFLTGAMLALGPARISNVFSANELAYHDATNSAAPQFANSADLQPIPDPLASLQPDLPLLPNRMNVSEADKTVLMTIGRAALPTVNLVNHAAYPSPAWARSNWPVASDDSQVQNWYQAYANQSKDLVQDPLMLSPAWPP